MKGKDMFTTSQGFKRLINEAYKGIGLRIGNDGAGYCITGGYWAIWIRHGEIPKKELAAIIELTGELPEKGEGFKATKDGNQYEFQWSDICDTMKNAEECDDKMEITPLTLKYITGEQARILQHKVNGIIVLINEKFLDMIDNTAVKYQEGETQSEGPYIHGKYPGVFWKNNVMALYVMPRKDEENKHLLGYLEAFDITGK